MSQAFNWGLNRVTTRTLMKDTFGKGFSNETFAAARRIWLGSREAGNIAIRLRGDYRVRRDRIPTITTNAARPGFKYSIKSQVVNSNSGEIEDFYTNIQSPTELTRNQLEEEVMSNIAKAGVTGTDLVYLKRMSEASVYAVVPIEGHIIF